MILASDDVVHGLNRAGRRAAPHQQRRGADGGSGTGSTFNLAGTIDIGQQRTARPAHGGQPRDLAELAGHRPQRWSVDGTGPLGAINSSLAAATPPGDGVGYGLGSQVAPTDRLVHDRRHRHARALRARRRREPRRQVNLADFNRLASQLRPIQPRVDRRRFQLRRPVNLSDFNALAGNFGFFRRRSPRAGPEFRLRLDGPSEKEITASITAAGTNVGLAEQAGTAPLALSPPGAVQPGGLSKPDGEGEPNGCCSTRCFPPDDPTDAD